MGCKYSYYKEEEKYYPYLYCKVDNQRCPFVKRCQKVEKFIHIDNLNEKECYRYVSEESKNIPKDSYFVQSYRPNNNGKLYLYVVIEEAVTRILSDFTEINQNYVYLKKNDDGYEISLVPFKKTVSRKKTEEK